MGGGGKGGRGDSASQTQAALAQQLFAQSGPLRDLLFGTPGTPAVAPTPGQRIGGSQGEPLSFGPSIAGSPAVPGRPGMLQNLLTNPPEVPFERDVLESQFGRAREGILAGAPIRGGQLASSLADLESQRALGVTGLAQAQEQQRIQNLFNVAGLATGQTQVSLGGLGQAGSTLAAAGAARQQSQLQALGGLGLGLGTAVGAGKAPGSVKAAAPAAAAACWIARALYGRRSIEAALARLWIFSLWRGRFADLCRFLYWRFGRRVSHWPCVLTMLRPWFDLAVKRARD